MSSQSAQGIARDGLDADFAAEEGRKSDLLLEARLLREQRQEAAMARFAEVAEIEERLSNVCADSGLRAKSFIHRFSAASCWAQAGNFYRAIALGDELLGEPDLPERLARRIQDYTDQLRARRNRWYQELIVASPDADAPIVR